MSRKYRQIGETGRALVFRVLLPVMLVVPLRAVGADRLGDLRLFFSAAERQAMDAEFGPAPKAEPGKYNNTDPGVWRSGSAGRETGDALPESLAEPVDARSPKAASALAGDAQNRPVLTRIAYSGVLTSSQGHTFLINGLPWQPGMQGIRAISRDAESGQIELQFATGGSAVLAIGQGIERAARP